MPDDPALRREAAIDRLERRIDTLRDLCDLMMVDSLVMAPVKESYALDIRGIVNVVQSATATLAEFRVTLLEEAHKETTEALREQGIDLGGSGEYDA